MQSSPGAPKARRLTFVPVTEIRTVDETACGCARRIKATLGCFGRERMVLLRRWLIEIARGGCRGTLGRRRVICRVDLTSLPPGVRSVKPELARGVRTSAEGTARRKLTAHTGLVTTSLDAPPAPIGGYGSPESANVSSDAISLHLARMGAPRASAPSPPQEATPRFHAPRCFFRWLLVGLLLAHHLAILLPRIRQPQAVPAAEQRVNRRKRRGLVRRRAAADARWPRGQRGWVSCCAADGSR
jgi:hypothetical protein